MKNLVLFFSLFCFFSTNFSQTPTSCFEITSILVDGCDGGNEGKNEMVGLRIGPNPINVNDLRIDGSNASGNFVQNSWPNNNFLGFCTTPQASANLQILNDAIVQCGQLLEPPGGILPAGSNVIIITSTDFTPIPSYFANLTETLYVVFQCAGNSAGHFVNFGSGAINTRTLIINHLPTSCSDTVTYNRTQLITSSGSLGAEDGGAVAFSFDGTPTYFNNGCQAPFTPAEVNVIGENNINNGPTACVNGTINLIGIISGDYSSFSWSGGTGTFTNPTSLTTEYQLGPGDVGTVTVTLTVVAPCNPNLTSSFQFSLDEPFTSPLTISPNGTVTLCNGASQLITVSGGSGTYSWSTGETSPAINISQTGSYSVTSENACETSTVNFNVINGNSPVLTSNKTTTTCAGECNASAIVNVNGGGNFTYQWGANANNSISNSVTGLCPGTYNCIVTSSEGCSSNIDVVITNPAPVNFNAIVTNASCSNTCDGSIEINENGGTAPYTLLIGNGTNNPPGELTNLCGGSYFIKIADIFGCESSTQTIFVPITTPIEYNRSVDQSLCFNQEINIGVNITQGNPSLLWSNGQTSDSISIKASSTFNTSNYPFTLTEGECVIKDTIKITSIDCGVYDSSVVVLPNIFTPNNDGDNDFFVPITFYNVTVQSFVILNRWGNVMVEFNDNAIKWDGLSKGKEANDGTYFYKMIYLNFANETKELHGFLQLVRE
jgi:gliding motility-associated-like protein